MCLYCRIYRLIPERKFEYKQAGLVSIIEPIHTISPVEHESMQCDITSNLVFNIFYVLIFVFQKKKGKNIQRTKKKKKKKEGKKGKRKLKNLSRHQSRLLQQCRLGPPPTAAPTKADGDQHLAFNLAGGDIIIGHCNDIHGHCSGKFSHPTLFGLGLCLEYLPITLSFRITSNFVRIMINLYILLDVQLMFMS